eukprot:TRINITY_DN704_c2_g1_i2.p1 TRINITY_DN704_c2_g1~~TRINITY_DN704_c2_g1_i2.p1  ORF type:complete len:911 (-),score=186.60 TRINITY_DN704_c2_g1_i2:711-3443(-)
MASSNMPAEPRLPYIPVERTVLGQNEFFFPIGENEAVDATEGLINLTEISLLYCGVGDLNDVLQTIFGLWSKTAHMKRSPTLDFHLNDISAESLARIIVLLYVAKQNVPLSNRKSQSELFLHLYSDYLLSEHHRAQLNGILQELLNLTSDEGKCSIAWLRFPNDSQHIAKIRSIWSHWSIMTITPEQATKARRKFVKKYWLGHSSMRGKKRVSTKEIADLMLADLRRWFDANAHPDLFHWSKEGTLAQKSQLSAVNPTMFVGSPPQYKVHPQLCPFTAFHPGKKPPKWVTLTESYAENFSKMMEAVRYYEFTCHIWVGDAMRLIDYEMPRTFLFDKINTSNLSRWIGLLNLLLVMAPRLKKSSTSTLCTTIPQDSLNVSMVVDKLMFPTLFDVELAKKEASRMRGYLNDDRPHITLYWRPVVHRPDILELETDEKHNAIDWALFLILDKITRDAENFQKDNRATAALTIYTLERIIENLLPKLNGVERIDAFIAKLLKRPSSQTYQAALSMLVSYRKLKFKSLSPCKSMAVYSFIAGTQSVESTHPALTLELTNEWPSVFADDKAANASGCTADNMTYDQETREVQVFLPDNMFEQHSMAMVCDKSNNNAPFFTLMTNTVKKQMVFDLSRGKAEKMEVVKDSKQEEEMQLIRINERSDSYHVEIKFPANVAETDVPFLKAINDKCVQFTIGNYSREVHFSCSTDMRHTKVSVSREECLLIATVQKVKGNDKKINVQELPFWPPGRSISHLSVMMFTPIELIGMTGGVLRHGDNPHKDLRGALVTMFINSVEKLPYVQIFMNTNGVLIVVPLSVRIFRDLPLLEVIFCSPTLSIQDPRFDLFETELKRVYGSTILCGDTGDEETRLARELLQRNRANSGDSGYRDIGGQIFYSSYITPVFPDGRSSETVDL